MKEVIKCVLALCFSIQAGCQALPPLLSIRQVMLQRQVAGVWSNREELPVSIVCTTYSFQVPC